MSSLSGVFSTFEHASLAVLRILSVIGVGALSASRFVDMRGEKTNVFFSVLNTYIFLPALFFGNFATTFDGKLFMEALPLFLFSFIRIFFGLGLSRLLLMFNIVDKETQPLVSLATSSCNAIAIPIALIGALRERIAFLSDSNPNNFVHQPGSGKLLSASEYVLMCNFVFTIGINASIWAIGFQLIGTAAAERDERLALESKNRKIEERNKKNERKKKKIMNEKEEDHQDEKEKEDDDGDDQKEKEEKKQEEKQLKLRQKEQDEKENYYLLWFFKKYVLPSLSVPFCALLSGLGLALVPGFKNQVNGGSPMLTAIVQGIKAIGDGAVISALLTVGITIYRTLKKTLEENEAKKEREEEEEEKNNANSKQVVEEGEKEKEEKESKRPWTERVLGISPSLAITTPIVQLILTPLVTFVIVRYLLYPDEFEKIHLLAVAEKSPNPEAALAQIGLDDPITRDFWHRKRLVLFALLVVSMTPSAMNTAVVVVLFSYRANEYSKMMVIQYLLAAVTMSLMLANALNAFY